MMKIYISGPMTGYQDYNHPAFAEMEKKLRKMGFEPLNPASNFRGIKTLSRKAHMRADIKMLLEADGIVFLPGAEESRGAMLEHQIAVELGLEFIKRGELEGLSE